MTEDELSNAYETYGSAVYRRCRRILGSESEALDTTQDVFLRALGHRRWLRPGRDFLGWCYRVGTRLCLTRMAARARCGEMPALELASQAPTPEQALLSRDLAAGLLVDCDKRTQEIAIYFLVDRMTQEEAAAMAGVSSRTVRKHLSRFLDHARRRLADWKTKETA
jgi:RNA polymerase sigma-70 factor (ECF subfamily)